MCEYLKNIYFDVSALKSAADVSVSLKGDERKRSTNYARYCSKSQQYMPALVMSCKYVKPSLMFKD